MDALSLQHFVSNLFIYNLTINCKGQQGIKLKASKSKGMLSIIISYPRAVSPGLSICPRCVFVCIGFTSRPSSLSFTTHTSASTCLLDTIP